MRRRLCTARQGDQRRGKVSSSHGYAAGVTVTLTAAPDNGCTLNTLTVTGSQGNAVMLISRDSGKYTFSMPPRSVTAAAVSAPLSKAGTGSCDGGTDQVAGYAEDALR